MHIINKILCVYIPIRTNSTMENLWFLANDKLKFTYLITTKEREKIVREHREFCYSCMGRS